MRALAASVLVAMAAAPLLEARAGAASASSESTLAQSPQVKGLRARYELVGTQEADLDGDGRQELVVAFKPKKAKRDGGGFAVISPRGLAPRLAWAGVWATSHPLGLSVVGGEIRAPVQSPRGKVDVVLVRGKDFFFAGEKGDPFAGATVRASSVLKGSKGNQFGPKNVLDGDLHTVWIDGALGTGVGEWIEIGFAAPVDLGLVGLLGGDFRSPEDWKSANRIFRFDVVVETQGDRTTLAGDLDITQMLKLPSLETRIQASAKDRRRFRWVEIAVRQVVSVKLLVTSVYLGEKEDDLHVSELALAVLLPEPGSEPPPPQPDAGAPPGAGPR